MADIVRIILQAARCHRDGCGHVAEAHDPACAVMICGCSSWISEEAV